MPRKPFGLTNNLGRSREWSSGQLALTSSGKGDEGKIFGVGAVKLDEELLFMLILDQSLEFKLEFDSLFAFPCLRGVLA